jgi:hypothetical protein
MTDSPAPWPALPLSSWKDSCDTLHMFAQIVGKVRLALAPPEPQWAQVPLYVTARGLTTSPIPYGNRSFQIDFDFISHRLSIASDDGRTKDVELVPRSVADFYAAFVAALHGLGIDVRVWPMPVEVPDPIAFPEDRVHAAYDAGKVQAFWRVLVQADAALKEHRAPFGGRHTPVQFFWGSFDLAYARFSGRPATPPSNDTIMRIAMDAQEVNAGFWPGDSRFPEPAFWCYAYPKPDGIERLQVRPPAAFWSDVLGEFVLRYEDVRASPDPRATLRDFFASTFEGCARLANWPTQPAS